MKKIENSINLKLGDLDYLKQIGAGTDGIIYDYQGNILIKIYREKLNSILEMNEKLNDDIKIYDRNDIKFKNYNSHLTYYETDGEEDIRIRTKNAIEKAVEKQKNVKRTELPKGSVYLENHFSGCYLNKVGGIQIHKLIGLPYKLKLKIMKNAFLDIEELLNNNIYHIDLGNSPFSISTYTENNETKIMNGHSHVLVNPITHKTNIIDLDGQSTIYKERYDENLENKSVISLCHLLTEFLYSTNIDEYEDANELYYALIKNKASKEVAYDLAFGTFNKFDELKKALKF